MAEQGGNSNTATMMREYRKGNWTVSETMVLIEAKKMDDERRTMMKRSSSGGGESSEGLMMRSKPAELRWKWVEDYCWRKGCLRSQNQCNDKWDNLMRDYKKVRDYERRLGDFNEQGSSSSSSYWKMEKNERKDKNLPSNMLPQIYEALVEVVERKGGGSQRAVVGGGGTPVVSGNVVVERPMSGGAAGGVQPPSPLLQHHHQIPALPPILPLPLPPPPPPQPVAPPAPPQPQQPLPYSQPLPTTCDSSDSDDTSEYSDSPAKRRRRSSQQQAAASGSTSSNHEVGNAISKSACVIAEALQACEEREERRHKELLGLHERRIQIEESKAEINRQGINGLVDAINKLANSILALASHKNHSPPK